MCQKPTLVIKSNHKDLLCLWTLCRCNMTQLPPLKTIIIPKAQLQKGSEAAFFVRLVQAVVLTLFYEWRFPEGFP